MTDNWSFLRLVAGVSLLFASVVGFAATVEHDEHCRLSDANDGGGVVSVDHYYSGLSDAERRVFDRLRENRNRAVQSDACVGGTVSYQEQYYVVDHWRTIEWLNPPTLLSLAVFLAGGGVVYSLVREQIDATPW